MSTSAAVARAAAAVVKAGLWKPSDFSLESWGITSLPKPPRAEVEDDFDPLLVPPVDPYERYRPGRRARA